MRQFVSVCVRPATMAWQNPAAGSLLQDPGAPSNPTWCHPSPGNVIADNSTPTLSWQTPSPSAALTESLAFQPAGVSGQSAWLTPTPGDPRGDAKEKASSVIQAQPTRVLRLDLATLMMIPESDNSPQESPYAKKDKDPGRIDMVLGKGCQCSSNCISTMNRRQLKAFCARYHSLSDDAQIHVLHAAYDTAAQQEAIDHHEVREDERHLRTEWWLLNVQCSVACLCLMLGVAKRTLYKKCHAAFDLRRPGFGQSSVREAPQSMVIDKLFTELYWSTSEQLPEFGLAIDDVDDWISENRLQHGESSPVFLPDWSPHQCAADIMASSVANPDSLPPHHLQHCHLSDLFWMFR